MTRPTREIRADRLQTASIYQMKRVDGHIHHRCKITPIVKYPFYSLDPKLGHRCANARPMWGDGGVRPTSRRGGRGQMNSFLGNMPLM